ncbi:hypothetical protein [uncultured Gelidibacter sp.]|uniref:hypothetical protein n=1 Tax=uncultured Gelidibacter sp. TaxID=259318 RepID=UPI00261DD00F|nr:hypothetical protein [uncultured Gelidibacter sp.]
MAEIKIEKKKPIWPWVILMLVVLAIIAYLIYANDDDDINDDFDDDYNNEQVIDTTDNTSAYDPYSTSTSYDQFTAFDQSITDSTRVAVDSSYTKVAFANLTKAVVHKADENYIEDSEALNDLRDFSSQYTAISTATKDTKGFKNFKTASDKVVKVMEDIQKKSFPSLQTQVADLKNAASKINGSVTMNKQQAQIYAFLRQSRDVLQSMNN